MMDDKEKEIERLALEELKRESSRSKIRVETMGAMGWQGCPLGPTNKRFLRNMLFSTLEPRVKRLKQLADSKQNPQSGEESGESSRNSRGHQDTCDDMDRPKIRHYKEMCKTSKKDHHHKKNKLKDHKHRNSGCSKETRDRYKSGKQRTKSRDEYRK